VTTAHTPSRRCYQLGCQRPECERANYRYGKQLKLDHARGIRRTCDATQVRVHIERLLAAEWTTAQIARAARLNHSTVSEVRGGQPAVSNRTALAIFSIHIGPPPEPKPVDATGSIRRLQALMCIGHSLPRIAPHAGMSAANLWKITVGRYSELHPKTAQAIARAYRKLSTTPGPSPQARAHARRNNWHGPMVWDDIDNPQCQPETGRRRQDGPGRREQVDTLQVARLTAEGLSAEQIARELRCHKRTVVRARSRTQDLATAA
jgi:hypothetical protein